MTRLRQAFKNSTQRPLFIFLELSTSRYRLEPGEELILFYDSDDQGNGPDTPLSIEYAMEGEYAHITIWTGEDAMFNLDGSEAELDFSLS